MSRGNSCAGPKLRLALFALLVFLCGAPLVAEAAPTTVNISWGENTDSKDVPGHITGKAFAIYDHGGSLQNVSGGITETEYSAPPAVSGATPVTYKIYKAAYSLEPGSYRWEGKSGDAVVGGGPFVVASTALDLSLLRAIMSIKPSDDDERGVRLDLYDYTDTGKTTPLLPYYVELFDSEKPELGVIEKRYLVLQRTKPDELYSYRISPVEDTVGGDDKPIYIKEGTFSATSSLSSAKNRMMTYTYFNVSGQFSNSGVIPLPAIKTIIFNVTHGADFHFYLKPPGYYGAYTDIPRKSFTPAEGEGGYDVHTFEVDNNSGVSGSYIYEAGGGEFVRDFMSFTPPRESVIPGPYTITVDLERLDARDWSAVDYDANWQDADMYLNVSDDRYLELRPNEYFDLRPLRVWQAVRDTMGNLHTEPDYHLEVAGASGGSVMLDSVKGKGTAVSNDVIEIEMTGDRGWERFRITGKNPGTAVIKITYDALTYSPWQLWNMVPNENGVGIHPEYPNHKKNTDGDQQLFYPTEPNCTAVVVVNVTENGAADNAGISTNIREREFDTIYFAAPQSSDIYTFAPAAAGGGEVSVRVHKPLHGRDVTWNENWEDYGGKASGSSFDVTLYEGHNIVEVSGGGAKKYHSIYAKPAKITVTNLTNPERGSDYFTIGDEVNINIKGLKAPVQKLAGIYNPGIYYDQETGTYQETGRFLYDADGVTLGSTKRQYDMKLGMDLRYVIQEEDTALRNGRIECSHYGGALGTHRGTNIVQDTGTDAEHIPGIYSTLPDIVFPTYKFGISLSETGTRDFGSAVAGYTAPAPAVVTVSNTGNQPAGVLTVALSGENAGAFELSADAIEGIAPGGTVVFTISPKTGLAVGVYAATVTVSGENGISESFGVTVTVLEPTNQGGVEEPPKGDGEESPKDVIIDTGTISQKDMVSTEAIISSPKSNTVGQAENAELFEMTSSELQEAINDGTIPESMAEFLSAESGVVTANKEELLKGLEKADSGDEKISVDEDKIIPLPIVSADLPSGKETAIVTFKLNMDEFDGIPFSDVLVIKQRNDADHTSEILARVEGNDPAVITSGRFAFTDGYGTAIPMDYKVKAREIYYLSVGIKDDSEYDWNGSKGQILDPIALSGKSSETGESSGGCAAGAGVLPLFVLLGAWAAAYMKKRR